MAGDASVQRLDEQEITEASYLYCRAMDRSGFSIEVETAYGGLVGIKSEKRLRSASLLIG
jgi:hypothetical protein